MESPSLLDIYYEYCNYSVCDWLVSNFYIQRMSYWSKIIFFPFISDEKIYVECYNNFYWLKTPLKKTPSSG